ncbi:acyltransferase family protein [Clostridium sp. YIM B02569]|uniref:acyltransferase family protein n=1 Tax=Clostridium sp. YIM B02569 TaxID=2911967 RepID=UPI001EEA747B|nr:acyltransferase family protein [Clostridium sp. YIM B02569]
MQNKIASSRIEYLDIAKGIGIIMVVWVHASGPFSSYMSQFHMPLFFLISGFLFNSSSSLKDFIIKKIKTLYIPFISCNIISIILQTTKSGNLKACFKQIFEILLTLNKDGVFFGATWFLGALFFISILYKILHYCLEDSSYKMYYITAFFIVLAMIGFEITFPYMLSRTLILGVFYALGYLIKINREKVYEFNKPIIIVLSFILFVIISCYNLTDLGKNKYEYKSLFIFGAIFAIQVTFYVSEIISKWKSRLLLNIKKMFIFLGENSIDILIWQFVMFKMVVLLQLYIDKVPLNNVWRYYPTYNTKHGWWLIYTILGTIFSIILGKILSDVLFKNIIKKIYYAKK